jgi:hypothetical protein
MTDGRIDALQIYIYIYIYIYIDCTGQIQLILFRFKAHINWRPNYTFGYAAKHQFYTEVFQTDFKGIRSV